ncbi:PilN domain-containing protein [Psychrobacter pygoscelis]|uniref:PilN domain-containing protein n=1 Tax=Psychrobacter pygoscelis TaxID=2488563 RepID=UPI00103CC582|nr:PilN domain-containing protein [Psychrobacter pygoscelis]
MARINLLPWRAAERERKNKEFITLVVAVTLFSLLAAFAAWSYFNNELTEQQNANSLIEQRNAELDTALTEIEGLEERRSDIISRIQVIQDLQGRRPIPVHIWDDIPKAIPPAMYINNLKREGDTITLTGLADNPNVVSSLIRNLDASEWLDGSAVRTIQQNISAYAPPPQSVTNTSEDSRPTYPEDNYVEFVVTTQVQHSSADQEQQQEATEVAAPGDAS